MPVKPYVIGLHRLFHNSSLINLPNDFGKIQERIMGGSGSGNRWRYGTKETLDASSRMDIRYLKKQRMLRGGYFSLSWNRNGEPAGNVNVRIVANESMTVIYRGGETQAKSGNRWKGV